MKEEFLKSLEKAFDLTAPPSKEEVMAMTEETIQFFRNLKGRLESSDPEKKKAAEQESIEVQKLLESKLLSLGEKTGLTPQQLLSLAQDPAQLPQEERAVAEEIHSKFRQFQEEATPVKRQQNLKTLIYR